MEYEKGFVMSAGPKFGFAQAPGLPRRIFWLTDAPPGLAKLKAVKYRVVPQPEKPHDLAVDIQLMDKDSL